MKSICKATVLALSLSVSAFAGDIATPGAPLPGTIVTGSSVCSAPTNQTADDWSATSSAEMYVVMDGLMQLVSLL